MGLECSWRGEVLAPGKSLLFRHSFAGLGIFFPPYTGRQLLLLRWSVLPDGDRLTEPNIELLEMSNELSANEQDNVHFST